MKRRHIALLTALAGFCALGAAPASAATVWNLEMHHNQTNFSSSLPGALSVETATQGSASQNEVQEITVTAESGRFALSFEGQGTGATGAGNTSSATKVITGVATTSGTFVVGEAISGTNIPADAVISNVNAGAATITFTSASNATATGPVSDLSAALPFNASSAGVQNALRALSTIGGTSVSAQRKESGSTRTYIVTFQGTLADTDVPQIAAANGAPPLALASHPQYWLDLDNVGSSASSGEIKLTLHLPAGITLAKVMPPGDEFTVGPELIWSCTGAATVECHTTKGTVPRHTLAHMFVEVNVEAGLPEGIPRAATATLEGGGAAKATEDSEPTEISSAPAGFGIVESSFVPDFFKANGIETEREAGGHPNNLVVPVDFNSVPAPTEAAPNLKREADSIRDLTVDLPPGFLGNPTAVGECTQAQYTVGKCPPSSQVGRFDGSVYDLGAGLAWNFTTGVFNMVHPRGAVTDLGFQVAGAPVHVKASLDPADRYAITTFLANINESVPPFGGKVTIWGVPAESSHDSERCQVFSINIGGGHTEEECEAEHAEKPFLSLPDQCEAENTFRLKEYDSWQHSGLPNSNPEVTYTMPGQMTGCEEPVFEPEVSLEPTGRQANTPTGLNVTIHVPQSEEPDEPATPPIKSTVVTLPEGMTVNPGFADGLAGCSLQQIGIEQREGRFVPNANPVDCPDNSRIGEVTVKTPLLPEPVEGSMYLARQEENPFHSLLAVYLALHDTEERGVLVKVPLELSLNPTSGQITTTATDLPQFPFEDLTLKFRSDERAPLINPPTCGSHEIAATMSSYAEPDETLNLSNTYQVTEGPGGGPCQNTASQRPFAPQLSAGTLNPTAGAFSPLNVRVFRTDADQELSSAEGTAPPGLLASLRGVGRCTDAQIAAARARNKPGEGALEEASPSCPANSQIGTLEAGAGAGHSPIYVPGKIYMAGPYEGAPLSGVAIVPAVAGPVDLGNVVVRGPVFIDPETAKVSLKTDPLPQIVDGVLIRTRDVRIHLDRPNFALNPTDCEPMAINATLRSTEGAVRNDSQRFQAGGCANLGFKPNLQINLKGGTKRGSHPALIATVTPRPGDANFSAAVVTLPHSAFLDQAHIRTICTRVQFAAGGGNGEGCPEGSVYGKATAYTPLLDEPLSGPVYLRSSSHNLPDLVVALHGPPSVPIDFDLSSRIDSFKGGIRSSFEAIPDAPVSKFVLEMQGQRKGLIVNSTDLCVGKHRAKADLGAQNGRLDRIEPAVGAAGCGKHGKKRKRDRNHEGRDK
jgi:hypothetical protein